MKLQTSSHKSVTDLLQKIGKALTAPIENHNYIQELLDELKNKIALSTDLADQLRAA